MSRGRRGVRSSSGCEHDASERPIAYRSHLNTLDGKTIWTDWDFTTDKICSKVLFLLCSCVNYGLLRSLASKSYEANRPLVATWDEGEPVVPKRGHVTRGGKLAGWASPCIFQPRVLQHQARRKKIFKKLHRMMYNLDVLLALLHFHNS